MAIFNSSGSLGVALVQRDRSFGVHLQHVSSFATLYGSKDSRHANTVSLCFMVTECIRVNTETAVC